MNTWKFVKSIVSGKRFFVLFIALLMVATQVTSPALGMISGGDPTDTDPIGVGNEPPPYSPPAQGFSWSMEKRFGPDLDGDGMVDYHWNPTSMTYDQNYVYPTSWKITINGCQTGNDYSNVIRPDQYDYMYTWTLDGTILSTPLCKLTRTFTDKATHPIRLTVTRVSDETTQTFPEQTIQVKDYFIVSIGDSLASGQGNPDIPLTATSGPFGIGWVLGTPASWQDERCMRSAFSSHALAALALEAADPHSSVTFISYACSGATINTLRYDDNDPLKLVGAGMLRPFRGEISDVPYSNTYENYIPAQMEQLQNALVPPNEETLPRQIDALLVSAGGNDIHFGQMVEECMWNLDCWNNPLVLIKENPTENQGWPLYDLVDRSLKRGEFGWPVHNMPDNYDALGVEINALDPKPLNVYITQYPEYTIGDINNGDHCRMLDDIAWPNPYFAVAGNEAAVASHFVIKGLNDGIFAAVNRFDAQYPVINWQYVDGLYDYVVDSAVPAGTPGLFAGPVGGQGHGYCASNNWIRRADESEIIQGPVNFRNKTKGTMHPNYSGQQVIKSRILYYMQPDLTGESAVEPPSFSFSYSSGGLTSQPGFNGWYLRSCDSNNACQPKVVGQAVASSANTLNGASISVNDTVGCTIAGVSCTTTLSTDQKQVTYAVEISATGTYRFQFNAQVGGGQVSFLQQEIKVDLEDPVLATPIGPFEVDEGDSVQLSAQVATTLVGDPPQEVPINEDVVVDYDWDLDNDGIFETIDEQPTFSAAVIDGPASLPVWVKVTDRAGRTATAQSEVHVQHVGPPVAINGAPVTSPEGTEIKLTSTVDSTLAAPFTYHWEVKKNGASYATGANADLSFTPNDNGSYEVALAVTKDGGSVGTASLTIDVTNVIPTVAINGAPAISSEGTTINLTKTVSDPGAADTFTYLWEVKKDGSSYMTGSEAGFSFTPNDNGSYDVSLQVTDDDYGAGTATSQTIDVRNVAPVLKDMNYSPATVNEGTSVMVSGGIGDPGTKDSLSLEIDWGDGSLTDTQALAAGTTSFTASHTYADDNPSGTASDQNTITVKITDIDNDSNSATGDVTVANLDPSLTISAPESGALYTVNAVVNLSASLTDPSSLDTLTCSVNWGDGATGDGTLAEGVCTASHSYPAAGVYTIQMTGTDDDLGSKTGTVMVVVFDPSAGFVTGGGWINSPAEAYTVDESLSGKATFGFVSKYQKGSTVPTGNTAFRFEADGFEFDSMAYEWLVVNAAGKNAQFKGTGMVNGALDANGNPYKFMLWAGDGSGADGSDTFRIRIWWEDDAAIEHDVYDNGTDQTIGGGSIVVHTIK